MPISKKAKPTTFIGPSSFLYRQYTNLLYFDFYLESIGTGIDWSSYFKNYSNFRNRNLNRAHRLYSHPIFPTVKATLKVFAQSDFENGRKLDSKNWIV